MQFKIRYSAIPAPSARELSLAAGPLLEACLAQAALDGVYLYQLNGLNGSLDLNAWRGLSPGPRTLFETHVDARASFWLLTQDHPSAHVSPAWRAWRLENLPEFVENRFQTAFTMPLTADRTLAGIVTFARIAHHPFSAADTAFLKGFQPLFGSLLSGTFSRDENARIQSQLQKITDRLGGRKREIPGHFLKGNTPEVSINV